MSEISGKVIIRSAEIRTEEELRLTKGAFLDQCIIHCDRFVEEDGPNKNAVGCLVYSKSGVAVCIEKAEAEDKEAL